jgi:hypothetical protein
MIESRVENVQQKYLVMRNLANEITKSGADAAILIGEVWKAPADQLNAYDRPTDVPFRTEALVLDMVSKSGEPLDLFAEIVKQEDEVTLGDTQVSGALAPFQFGSFYRAWGRPVPQAWDRYGQSSYAGGAGRQ